jgi:hypothetical protein
MIRVEFLSALLRRRRAIVLGGLDLYRRLHSGSLISAAFMPDYTGKDISMEYDAAA